MQELELLVSPTLADALEAVENDALTRTEKGAVAFKSTLKATLDFFGQGASLRTALSSPGWGWGGRGNQLDADQVANAAQDLFSAAYREDRLTALKIWAWMGDIRGGQGERIIRRAIMRWLAISDPNVLLHNLGHLPTYFRWDDLYIATEGTQVEGAAWKFVCAQLEADLRALDRGESITLLGKWMPSENTSSKVTRARARKFIQMLGWTPRRYRQSLVRLRERIGIVEKYMSAKQWERIEFEKVPSNASYIYRKAFAKHDPDRYTAFLDAVEKGEVTIHSSTLYPYELVGQYWRGYNAATTPDRTVEAQWAALPNFLGEDKGNSLVICDVSGSMYTGGVPAPIVVALSLTIYTAERNSGFFHDKFLTFSHEAELMRLKGNTLQARVMNLSKAPWGNTTNLMSAFNLILDTAVNHKVRPEDMPDTLFIISDMQFDSCVNSAPPGIHPHNAEEFDGTALQVINAKYEAAGYQRPNIVFWNVRATDNVPVRYNDDGVALVSGFHPSTFAQLLGKIETPLHTMAKTVYSERYEPISLP